MLATWWDSLVLRVPVAQPLIPTVRRLAHPNPDAMRPGILGLENPLLTALFALFLALGLTDPQLENDTMIRTVAEENLRPSIRPGRGKVRRAVDACGVYVTSPNGKQFYPTTRIVSRRL